MGSIDPEQVFKDRAAAFNTFRFHWEIKDMVAGSAMPGRSGNIADDFEILKKNGITLIINLTCRQLHIPSEFSDYFDVCHIPVIDGQAPSEQQLVKIINLIRSAVSKGKRAVIHCRGGIGRTATVLVPLMMDFEKLPLKEAIKKVNRSGRFTQSREQKEFLELWAKNRQ